VLGSPTSFPKQAMSAAVQRSAAPAARDSLPALTGIRFFAAIYVVLFHSLPWLESHARVPISVRTFASHGYLAVALFFLLSGFILAYSYESKIAGGSNRASFWKARFARIYPVYLLSLLLALPFQTGLSKGVVLPVLAMVQAWNPLRPELTGAWNYPAWSLSVEMLFYLCFPFLQVYLARRSRNSLMILAGGAAVLAVLLHTPTQGLGDRSPLYGQFVPLAVLRLPEFVLGVSLGNLFLRRERERSSVAVTLLAVLAAVVLLSVQIGQGVALVIVPFSVLLYQLASPTNRIGILLSSRPMILLGGASYSVYLMQAPVRDWVRVLSTRFLGSGARFVTPLTPVVLVLASILVFKFWEEPWRRAIRRWLGTSSTSAASDLRRAAATD
jgi:peptidoglycan/LPS O-acetylase OafA/YrhL